MRTQKNKKFNPRWRKKGNKRVLIDETKHKKEIWSEERGGMSAEMQNNIRSSKHKIKVKKEHEKGRKEWTWRRRRKVKKGLNNKYK